MIHFTVKRLMPLLYLSVQYDAGAKRWLGARARLVYAKKQVLRGFPIGLSSLWGCQATGNDSCWLLRLWLDRLWRTTAAQVKGSSQGQNLGINKKLGSAQTYQKPGSVLILAPDFDIILVFCNNLLVLDNFLSFNFFSLWSSFSHKSWRTFSLVFICDILV